MEPHKHHARYRGSDSVLSTPPFNKMTDQEFFLLCTATSRELGLDDVDMLADEGEITLQDVRMGLYFSAQTDDVISCYVDIGYIDEAIRPAVFARALAVNLEINGVHGEALSFDADSGHLILRASINPVLGCEAEQLSDWLQDYAEFAATLRKMMASMHADDVEAHFMMGTLA